MKFQTTPLAERLRPTSLEQYIGQEHLVGENAVLRHAIESGRIHSMIFWGPPGVGKTTLASIISKQVKRQFYVLNAVSSGVKDVREVFDRARMAPDTPILFIDEIHRFNKSQQDSLLNAVEKGLVILIGATTENPSFEVISPLLSRCQIYVMKPLEKDDLEKLVSTATAVLENDYGKKIVFEEKEALMHISGGDARKLLNAIDLVVGMMAEVNPDAETLTITNEITTQYIQSNLLKYDRLGDMHYDIISAFIKSIRGSDPDAAIYWLARMIAAGEDPKFIARRLVISASEDIGLANPNALLLANACFDTIHKIGWPEGRIPLAETTIYLATSPKSNSAYNAINSALELVEKTGNLPVPLHLRNAPTKLMKELNYGKEYQYAHDFPNHFVAQQYMPDALVGRKIWEAQPNVSEAKMDELMKKLWGK